MKRETIKYVAAVIVLAFGLFGTFGPTMSAATQESSSSKKGTAKKQAPAPSGAVAVFGTCNNSGGSCTAQASCPAGKSITTGTAFYIVPDGKGPAYGTCGTGSTTCQPGNNSCVINSAIEPNGCGSPGWSRQIVEVAISCQ